MNPASTGTTAGSRVYRLNPLVRIRFDDGIGIDLPLHRRSFHVDDPQLLAVLPLLADGGTAEELAGVLVADGAAGSREEAAALIDELVAAELLSEGADEPPAWAAAQHWIDRGWLEALLFHAACETDSFTEDGADDADTLHDELLRGEVSAGLPSVWTRYHGRPTVDLPAGRSADELPPLEQVLLARRSNQPWRRPSGPALDEVATVLRLASAETVAVRRRMEAEIGQRPSALLHSAFTALELYLVAHQVQGLAPGLYHYEPDQARLRLLREADLRQEMQRMCVGQQRAGTAGAVFVITVTWDRYMRRYRHPAAYRSLMMNVGELAHKLVVLSTAVGLSTFITPAFDDAYADQLMGLDPVTESAIEAIGVG